MHMRATLFAISFFFISPFALSTPVGQPTPRPELASQYGACVTIALEGRQKIARRFSAGKLDNTARVPQGRLKAQGTPHHPSPKRL
jgi:hypothetical protein